VSPKYTSIIIYTVSKVGVSLWGGGGGFVGQAGGHSGAEMIEYRKVHKE